MVRFIVYLKAYDNVRPDSYLEPAYSRLGSDKIMV